MPAITVVPVAYISGRHRRFRPLLSTPGLLDRAPELTVSSSPGSLLSLLQFVAVEAATASDRRCRIDLAPLRLPLRRARLSCSLARGTTCCSRSRLAPRHAPCPCPCVHGVPAVPSGLKQRSRAALPGAAPAYCCCYFLLFFFSCATSSCCRYVLSCCSLRCPVA